MNNPSPNLTNVYLDNPPVGLAPEPLEYSPPPDLLGHPQVYTQTRIGDVPHTFASPPPPTPPPPPPRTNPQMYPPPGQSHPCRDVQNSSQV